MGSSARANQGEARQACPRGFAGPPRLPVDPERRAGVSPARGPGDPAPGGSMTRHDGTARWSRAVPILALALAIAAAWAVAGCGGGGGGGGETGPTRVEQIRTAVEQAGKVAPLGPDTDTVTDTTVLEEGDYQNTYEQHDAIKNLEGVAYLGLNDDIIWPGSLVTGEHLHQFVYEPIIVPRGPITLSVSLESAGGTGQLSLEVTDPMLSTVRQGIQDLLAQAITPGTTVPAKVDYREERVSNVSHMNLFIGADVSYGSGSLSTRFDWSSTERRNKMLAKYTQIYYTVDVDPPVGPEELFASSVTPEQVAEVMPPGSRPVYVASVAYGMMAVLCIETDFSEDEMKTALDFAWSGTFDAEVKAGYSVKDVLQSSTITIIVYGGSPKNLGDVETGYEGFQKVLDASKEYGPDTPGVPILYKFRHLGDNTLAQVSLTSQYTVVKALQLRQRIEVIVDQFICTSASDEWGSSTVDIDTLQVWVNAWQRVNLTTPEVRLGTEDMVVYDGPGGEKHMSAGTTLTAGSSALLEFNTRDFDFSLARLELSGHARDQDDWSPDDHGYGLLPITSSQLNLGTQRVMTIESAGDFKIDAYIRLLDATR